MTRTQIQFPAPLYQQLKHIAEKNDWSLAEVVRRAADLYVCRFSTDKTSEESWSFPTLSMGGDFLTDPAQVKTEAETISQRNQ